LPSATLFPYTTLFRSRERMHGMVTGERKARDNRLGFFSRNDCAIPQRVADDAIVDLGVKRALVERDSGSAVSAFGKGFAEAVHRSEEHTSELQSRGHL